ncbi:MAG: NAD-dependent epimerase/dehydratase family protein [Deltaproteobacteria bacterium]|nr:NAD-dependent epimerase/dehydratase family protein [Deltaproteobacteria bacterium]
MKVLVTGATGFIGGHLTRLLVERGDHVRALVRPASDREMLSSLEAETVFGDVRDCESVVRAAKGCDTVFHVAADYRLWVPNPSDMYETNVQGTVNVLEAALAVNVHRVVYTSTVGALGIPKNGSPGDETTPVKERDLCGPYKRSKYLAEQKALAYNGKGLPVVIVNPSTPVGPGDRKPTPTGKMIVDFLNGKIPAFLDTGLNLVHVEDVAEGHILAHQRGKPGEKYILGCRNLTLAEIFRLLAEASGLPAPKIRLPYAPVLAAAYVTEAVSRSITHREPLICLNAVRMAKRKMFFDNTKAVRELGISQTPVERALEEAVTWFRNHDYVHRTTLPEGLKHAGC